MFIPKGASNVVKNMTQVYFSFSLFVIIVDTVMEVPLSKTERNDTTEVESLTNSNLQQSKPSAISSETSGDLGSIVTLVGKSKPNEHENTKRMKQNETGGVPGTNEERNAHKKTMETSEHLALKNEDHSTSSSSSETNAANVNQVTGPSNSIIVSSVIVVLIAAFVVVGMAVVAFVAVVARHCNLGKHLQTAS